MNKSRDNVETRKLAARPTDGECIGIEHAIEFRRVRNGSRDLRRLFRTSRPELISLTIDAFEIFRATLRNELFTRGRRARHVSCTDPAVYRGNDRPFQIKVCVRFHRCSIILRDMIARNYRNLNIREASSRPPREIPHRYPLYIYIFRFMTRMY